MSDADESEATDDPIETIAKPDALLALHDVTAEMFAMLRELVRRARRRSRSTCGGRLGGGRAR